MGNPGIQQRKIKNPEGVLQSFRGSIPNVTLIKLNAIFLA